MTSRTPSLKVVQWRSKPGLVGLVAVNATPGSSSKSSRRTVAMAPLTVVCPETYSGKFGVATRGVQPGSASVARLSSSSARWIAVTGRQKLKAYFASQHAIRASAPATFMSAKARAASEHDLTKHRVPNERGRRQPESRDVGLLRGPCRAVQRADFLDLVQVPGVAMARQTGTLVWPELRARLEHPWLNRSPAR